MSAEQLGDSETAAQVRAYLVSVRLISGCCWCDDEGVHRGRLLIERLAGAIERGAAEQGLSPSEAADVVRFVHSVEPSGVAVDADEAETGLHIVLHRVEGTLRAIASAEAVEPRSTMAVAPN